MNISSYSLEDGTGFQWMGSPPAFLQDKVTTVWFQKALKFDIDLSDNCLNQITQVGLTLWNEELERIISKMPFLTSLNISKRIDLSLIPEHIRSRIQHLAFIPRTDVNPLWKSYFPQSTLLTEYNRDVNGVTFSMMQMGSFITFKDSVDFDLLARMSRMVFHSVTITGDIDWQAVLSRTTSMQVELVRVKIDKPIHLSERVMNLSVKSCDVEGELQIIGNSTVSVFRD